MDHDPDDPPPAESDYWYYWNRWAEELMRLARLFGFLSPTRHPWPPAHRKGPGASPRHHV
jgi:hypothetical protein